MVNWTVALRAVAFVALSCEVRQWAPPFSPTLETEKSAPIETARTAAHDEFFPHFLCVVLAWRLATKWGWEKELDKANAVPMARGFAAGRLATAKLPWPGFEPTPAATKQAECGVCLHKNRPIVSLVVPNDSTPRHREIQQDNVPRHHRNRREKTFPEKEGVGAISWGQKSTKGTERDRAVAIFIIPLS
nr:hypothetical protein [Pandoravirus massiliensis]